MRSPRTRLKKSFLFFLLITLAISVFVGLYSSEPGKVIAVGDNFPYFTFNLNHWLDRFFSIWDGSFYYGLMYYNITSFLRFLLSFVLHNFVDAFLLDIVIRILSLWLGFISIGIFFVHFFKKNIALYIGSLVYIFNFITFPNIWTEVYFLFFVLLPLGLTLLHKIYRKSRVSIALFLLLSTFFSYQFSNPPLLAVLLSCFVCFAGYLLFSSKKRGELLVRYGITAFLVFLVNLWWIIPVYFTLFAGKGTDGSSITGAVTNVNNWGFVFARSTLLNIFQFNSSWAWRPEYVSFIEYFDSPLITALMFVPILLVTLGLVVVKDKKYTYLYGVLLLLLFLIKGLHTPLTQVNNFFYDHVPLLWLIREPNNKLYPVVALITAVLIVELLNVIIKNRKKTFNFILIVIIFLYSILVPFPFLYNSRQEKTMVTIPPYWFQISDYLNSKKEFYRVLVLPENDFYMMPYEWYYGVDGWPQTFINAPTVKIENVKGYVSFSDYSNLYSQQIYQKIRDGQSIAQLLGEANISYILKRNDIKGTTEYRDSGDSLSNEVINEYLQSQVTYGKLRKDESFGKLDLYKVPSQYIYPHIYAEKGADVKTSFKKNNYSYYTVNIENIKEPTRLIFSEGFHKNWMIYPSSASHCINVVMPFDEFNTSECQQYGGIISTASNFGPLWKEPLFTDSHENLKTFANSWIIDPNMICRNQGFCQKNDDETYEMELIVEFWPQRLFYIGMVISGITFMFCLGYLAFDFINRRRAKYIV